MYNNIRRGLTPRVKENLMHKKFTLYKTVREYYKEIGCDFEIENKSEEELVENLIESHAALRKWNLIQYNEMRNWSRLRKWIARKFGFYPFLKIKE